LPGGIITLCVYTGHPGGSEEGEAVMAWSGSLPPGEFNAWAGRQANRGPTAPYLVLVEKAAR
ncbi:MAG TPA: class I SAM-dependent methyltransferase, partial [Geobacteraceae bacterium]